MLIDSLIVNSGPAYLLGKPFSQFKSCTLDFSDNNLELLKHALSDTKSFSEFVFRQIKNAGAEIGIGGYLENRVIYRRSTHFNKEEEKRSVHLGVDIWTHYRFPIFAPLEGKIHSFRDNNNFGDYGPTIVLEHQIENEKFYTLYGHLSRESLDGLSVGKFLPKGTKMGEIGNFPENGDWPPHLHFQVITDMLGNFGDFPGVCTPSRKDFYSGICPNPMILIR